MHKNETRISQMYKDIKLEISKSEICEIIHNSFNDFMKENKSKTIDVKCLNFQSYRQGLLSYLTALHGLNSWNEKLNSLIDYIDNNFSFLFFKGYENYAPLHKTVDDEFYFSLLTFCVDRIEFPSLVNNDIFSSFDYGKRSKVNLKRRNYLSTLMIVSRSYFNQTFEVYSNALRRPIGQKELDKFLKTNKMRFQGAVSVATDKANKKLSGSLNGKTLTMYRGYDISSSQNVIVDRKKRVQDSNKSCSFTLDSRIAEHFARYKVAKITDEFSTSYQDRIYLVSDWMDMSSFENYEKSCDRKYVVSKYEISIDDVIFSPVSTTITEFEVIANPDKATLTRYSIIYAT